ncbi:hypothetical protein GJQ57_09255 [Ralstonia pickettii]|uniref:Transmembrane protein n=1 Tax=Ralstonia pickettii TaxID=329 RepID=A0A7X2LAE2_RALPI|nr:hypothetical protein [Ralstonia pickettii]MRS98840.1 hypothetical protein [Ralstonia pickettii]
MDSLLHPSAAAPSGFANAARLMRHAGLLAGAAFCLGLALPAHAEVTSDSAGLDLPDVKAINNQPISKPTHGAIHNERVKPSFDYRDNDGTQVEEYRFQKGQAPDIHVKSGMGTSYNLSKPEDSSPRIRERGDIDRVPSVNVLKF